CQRATRRKSVGALHHFHQPPALRLAQRAGLLDTDQVADVAGVLFVVGLVLLRRLHRLLVKRVILHTLHRYGDGLVHRGARNESDALLAASASTIHGLGL